MRNFIPAIAALAAFLVAWSLGAPMIPLLKRLKFGQTILEDGPEWHKSKQGTPTMGGLLIVAGFAVGVAIAFGFNAPLGGTLRSEFDNSVQFTQIFAGIGLAVGMGLIGFFDDYIKVVKSVTSVLPLGRKRCSSPLHLQDIFAVSLLQDLKQHGYRS